LETEGVAAGAVPPKKPLFFVPFVSFVVASFSVSLRHVRRVPAADGCFDYAPLPAIL